MAILKGTSGDDTIMGINGSDVITGGLGHNTIKYNNVNELDGDKINLTKGENLDIDVTDIEIETFNSKVNGRNLDITINGKTFTLVNFGTTDVTNNKTAKTPDTSSVNLIITNPFDIIETIDLRTNGLSKFDVTKNYTGTWLADSISARDYENPQNKGLNLNGGAGNDTIVGSNYNDTIVGGVGDDVLFGGAGDDTFTGGLGENSLVYNYHVISGSIEEDWSNFGNDTVNLTKDEILNIGKLDFTGIDENERFKKGKNANDLLITSKYGTITVKNYFTKDTGATVNIYAKDNGGDLAPINLTKDLLLEKITAANYFDANPQKLLTSYTGTALADNVDASGVAPKYDNKGNLIEKGVTINTSFGNDSVIGSNFNDTVNAGAGDDTIIGGNGNDSIIAGDGKDTITGGLGDDTLTGGKDSDTFIFSAGDGADVITDATNEDIIKLNISKENIYFLKNGNHLQIRNTQNSTDNITINNYFINLNKNTQIDEIWVLNNEVLTQYSLKEDFLNNYTYPITGQGKINGTANKDTIYGSNYNDIITAGNENDIIYNSKGNDTITGGTGENTIKYTTKNFGSDSINLTKGEKLTIDLSGLELASEPQYSFSGKNLVIETTEGIITLNNFGTLDVTNNETKTSENDSYVKLITNGEPIDLREKVYDVDIQSNYTGNWHNENIDATNTPQKFDKRNNPLETGVIINAGAGDDKITGSKYNDTITGGTGTNTIIIDGNEASIGTNTINLTKEETLILNFKNYNDLNAETFANTLKVNGKNLEINLNNGKLILVNFVPSDITNGIKIKFNDGAEPSINNLNDVVLSYSQDAEGGDFNVNEKNHTATFTGSRFKEKIVSENSGKATTINGGAGYNTITLDDNTITTADAITGGNDGNNITINKDGNKTVTTGNGDDTIEINGVGTHTVKTGNGTNTVIINGDGKANITGGVNTDNITVNNTTDNITINAGNGENTISLDNIIGTNTINGGTDVDILTLGSGIGTTTANLGNGENIANINYSGISTIISGKDNDIINIATGNGGIFGTTNIKAGAGENTININNSVNFGKVTLFEERVNATNIINFTEDFDDNYEFIKNGNDLIIKNGDSQIQINDFYAISTAKVKYATKIIKINGTEINIADKLSDMEKTLSIAGSGVINGTDEDNIIYGSAGNNKINALGGDDFISSGAGNDTVNAGLGNNTIYFSSEGTKVYNDTVLNGGGTDTLQISEELKSITKSSNDLIIVYGANNNKITVKGYYTGNHSVQFIKLDTENKTYTIQQAINLLNQGTELISPTGTIKINGSNINMIFDSGKGVKGPNSGINYIYSDNDGSILRAGSDSTNYLIGGQGDDELYGSTGNDYFAGGAGHNEIHVSKGGGRDRISLAKSDEDNVIIFDNITFSTDNEGKVNGLGGLTITDTSNGYQTDSLYIYGYGNGTTDMITADSYFYNNESGWRFYYEGYTLQDKNGKQISLTDAVKMSINREADTNYTVGNMSGNSTNETFYTNSTDEAIAIQTYSQATNGVVNSGAGDDTIYSGGIYQYENGTLRPVINGGSGNDIIHAEGGKIYFTTSRTDLQYSDNNLISVQTHQTNNETTYTTVYDADHIYITPDNKIMTGYFFFAYDIKTNGNGERYAESITLDNSENYEFIGAYEYSDFGGNVYVYHTDDIANCKIEGKRTYFFDYGDKVASGQVEVYGDDGNDEIFIGNGSTAYGEEGNDTITGDGIAYGGDGNDKIIFSNNNHYFHGLGYTYYYADGGKGNDYVDMSDVVTREHEAIELSSQSVEYENEFDTMITFSEGVDTLVINPNADKNIIIDMRYFAENTQYRRSEHADSDTQFGAFQRGDDLYLTMNNSGAKNGTLIIKDYFAYEKDEHGELILDNYDDPIRVYSDERRANLHIWFAPSIRQDGYEFLPQSYMALDEFIQHYNDWKEAQVIDDVNDSNNGHKDYDYYNQRINVDYNYYGNPITKGGYVGRNVDENNTYYTFIDNQEGENPHQEIINGNKETPEYFKYETVASVEDPNHPTVITHTDVKVWHNAGYYIIGGDGAQTIYGGEGDDVIYGDNIGNHDANGNWTEDHTQDGADKIYAGAGDDYVVGGSDNDFIDGGEGQNMLYGGEGDDTIIAGNPNSNNYYNANSYAYGEEGNDILYAQAVLNNDGTLKEEESNAYLGGEENKGTTYLYGGEGDDTIVANSYHSVVEAGEGNDTVKFYNNNGVSYAWWNSSDTGEIHLGKGNDKFYAYGNGAYIVEAESGDNLIDARGSSANGSQILGGTGTDTIYGGSGNDYILTGLGNAIVDAGAGNDTIGVNNDYYSSSDMHKSDIIHGGAGNDSISASGHSEVYGDEGNDTISLDGGSRYVPSALTIDGGADNDIYQGKADNGINTIIASEGNDTIKFFEVTPKCFKMQKNGYDLIIQKTSADGTNVGLTVLKNYYVESQQALFNNWTIETYEDDERSPKKGQFTMQEFVEYLTTNPSITDGTGTNGKDYIEAADSVSEIDGKAGDDNIVSGKSTEKINGGAGNDLIQGSTGGWIGNTYYNKQIILGDSGNASVVDQGEIYGTSNVPYTITYTPAADTSGDGNDTITTYAERSYVWGEGGNDVINVMAGTQSHIWGGAGNDTITAVKGTAQQILGEEGNDYIKAKSSFINGGVGNDTIIHKFGGYSSGNAYDSYYVHKEILKNNFGVTQNWIDTYNLSYDEGDIVNPLPKLANSLSSLYSGVSETLSNISWYEYILKQCGDSNGYGGYSKSYWESELNGFKTDYYGAQYMYDEYSRPIIKAYESDVEAGNEESLAGTKGSKDIYIETILDSNKTQEQRNAAKAAYEADCQTVEDLEYYVKYYDDLRYGNPYDYSDIAAINPETGEKYTNFRAEGDKAYWQAKVDAAIVVRDGITGTEEAYNKLSGSIEAETLANYQNKLAEVQQAYAQFKAGETITAGSTFRNYSKEYFENKYAELNSYQTGLEGSANIYARYKDYVDNYDEYLEVTTSKTLEEWQTALEEAQTDCQAKLLAYQNGWEQDKKEAWEEAKALVELYQRNVNRYEEFTQMIQNGNQQYWEGKQAEALVQYHQDQFTYDLYNSYYTFYYDNDFVDNDYQNRTTIKYSDGTAAYTDFRDEAQNEGILWYDGEYRNYWAYQAKLALWRLNGYQGTIAVMEEMYQRNSIGQIPYSTYKNYYNENLRLAEAMEKLDAYYTNYDNANYKDGYALWSSESNFTDEIARLQKLINGSSYSYETAKTALLDAVEEFKEGAPSDEALKLVSHISNDIIIGGEGNDTISVGHIDEDDEYKSNGSALVMGGEGDDTYIIDDIKSIYSNSDISYSNIEIFDHQGTNTLKFTTDDMKSGNIEFYANVALVKDENGNYIKDANGNYQFRLADFGEFNDDGSSYASTPLYDGKMGFSVIFIDADKFSNMNGTSFDFKYLSRFGGVKLDNETLATLDYIWSADDKYITIDQLNKAMQNTANWLAEHNYDCYTDARRAEDSDNFYKYRDNLVELKDSRNLGSLEWITPTGENGTPNANDIINPATEGLVGTNANDTLVINSAPTVVEGELNNVIDLKYGNDKVTFEGTFGDYIIKSDSTTDNSQRARQTDTITLEGYSVQDGTIKFSMDDRNLILTAYDNEGEKVGSVTYQNFLGTDYDLRSFILKADDHEYLVTKEMATNHVNSGSNVSSVNVQDDNNPYYNIKFIESTEGATVYLYTNGKRAYYYTIGDTPLNLSNIKEGDPVEVFSNGNTNDRYSERITSETNIIIHDAGGDDDLYIQDNSWNGTSITDKSLRLFFDVDTEGNVSDARHIVLAQSFKPSETVLKQYGSGENIYYREEEVSYFDTENLLKLLNNDPDHMKGVITLYGDIERVQTNDHYNHNERLVYAEDVDTSIKLDKYIKVIKTDLIPWLENNGYTSVKQALTSLTNDIAAKQELMENVAIDSDEFSEYSNAIAADNAKIDELLGFFNYNYDAALMRNLYGTDGDDNLSTNMYYDTERVIAGKGNDTIDLTNYNVLTSGSDAKVMYNFAAENGDGHDIILNSNNHNSIYVDKGEAAMFTKFRTDGWDLKVEFYSNNEATENPEGSITISDYFKSAAASRLDKLFINGVENSISEMIGTQGVLNANALIGTTGSDNFVLTDGDDVIYPNGEANNSNDTIASSKGNDTIYITNSESNAPKITYLVGDDDNSHGDDVIYGARSNTYLTVDFGNTNAQTEYRKIGADMKMIFFMGEGEAKHKVGSITIKDYYDINMNGEDYEKITLGYSDKNNTRFKFIKNGTVIPMYSTRMLSEYVSAGGSLVDNGDVPYFNETLASNSANSTVETTATTNTLTFNDVETFRNLNYEFVGDDLVVTHGEYTTTIEGFKTGETPIKFIRVGNFIKSVNEKADIPSISISSITGTDGSDNLFIPNGTTQLDKITTNYGEDKIITSLNDMVIDAGDGNDYVELSGTGNTVYGGYGDDTFKVTGENAANTFIIGKRLGDSYTNNDQIIADKGNVVLKFVDTEISSMERLGNDLIIKHNLKNDKTDSVTLKDYYKQGNQANYTIETYSETKTVLNDFIKTFCNIEDVANVPVEVIQNIPAENYLNNKFIFMNNDEITGFSKSNNDLIIRYSNGTKYYAIKDFFDVNSANYFNKFANYGNSYSYKVIERQTSSTTITDYISSYLADNDLNTVPNSDLTTITGSNSSDYIFIPEGQTQITTVNAGGGNDVIKGSINNATINGGAGNDIMEITGHGNTIDGGTDNDIFRVTTDSNNEQDANIIEVGGYHGKKTVENCSGNVTIHINNTPQTLEKIGDDLIIKWGDNSYNVIIREYFDENGCNKDANFKLKVNNNEPVALDDYISTYKTNKEIDEIPQMTTKLSGNYINVAEGNSITQIEGTGNMDTINAEIDNANINGGWGDDIINVTGSGNIIRGDRGNDRINISAQNGETNTLVFADGEWGGSSTSGNDVVNAVGGNLRLEFSDQYLSDLKLARLNDYLLIKYNSGGNTIYLQDYFKENVNTANITLVSHHGSADIIEEMSLTDFITQNYESTININQVYGTDGDDKFINKMMDNTEITYNLGKGNDIVDFEYIDSKFKDSISRKAVVTSEAEKDKYGNIQNTDHIILKGYEGNSVSNKNIVFNFGEGDDIVVTANHKKTDSSIVSTTEVTIKDYLKTDDKGFVTADVEFDTKSDYTASGNYAYRVHRYNTVQNLDTYNSYEHEYDHPAYDMIYIKAASGVSRITSGNSDTHQILTDGGADLNYYGDNGDRITTKAASNDTYNLDGFGVKITDNGGNDTINLTGLTYLPENSDNFYNDLKQIYLSFNVDKNGNTDDTFVLSKSRVDGATQYILSGKTDTSMYNEIVVTAARTNGKNIGIEHVYASKNDNNNYTQDANGFSTYQQIRIGEINMETWYDAVKQDVVAWLNNAGYESTADFFKAYNEDTYGMSAMMESLENVYKNHSASQYMK